MWKSTFCQCFSLNIYFKVLLGDSTNYIGDIFCFILWIVCGKLIWCFWVIKSTKICDEVATHFEFMIINIDSPLADSEYPLVLKKTINIYLIWNISAAFAQTVEQLGGLDIVVNNAGIFEFQRDAFQRIIDINLVCELLILFIQDTLVIQKIFN